MSDLRPTSVVDKAIAGHWRVTLDNPPINVIDDQMGFGARRKIKNLSRWVSGRKAHRKELLNRL